MPPWTEALEIEYMSQDQLKRVIGKLREEGMSDADIKLGEDLFYRRSVFKVDQFVKMCEVREIVQQALHSILDKMRKADETGRKNRTEISSLDAKTKTLQQQVSHLKRLENGQNSLIRMQKEQEMKLADINNKIMDWQYQASVKQGERENFDKELTREVTRVKALTEHMQQQCKQLEESQQKTNERLIQFQDDQRELVDTEMADLKKKFENLPAEMDRQILIIKNMNGEIKSKMNGQFATIL